jgi:hypothetical protein
MDYTEKVDARSCRWLLSQLSPDFLQQHTKSDDKEEKFTFVKKILQKMDNQNGIVKVKYEKKDKFAILRDYTQGVQSLPSVFRGLICRNMTDVDMVNAHPVIIYNLCKKHNVPCLYLEEYCKNRKQLIQDGKCNKLDIIRSINKKQLLKTSGWLKSFDIEMKEIQKKFFEMPEYEQQRILSESNSKNRQGAFMSHLATTFEVQILHSVIHSVDVEVGVLMFDGFMFYGDKPNGFLEKLTELVKTKTGFDIEWSYKEHDTTLNVPNDWNDNNPEQLYNDLKRKYETDYGLAFIEKGSMFSYKISNKIEFLSKNDLELHFSNVLIGKQTFLKLWLQDTDRQTYTSVGVYPHDVKCPDGILNIWTGYDVEKLPESDADITPMLNHLKIITKEAVVYEFLLDWLANMFQFPSSRSVMVIIQGEEGSGKSVLCDFISNILGKDTAIEINDVKENLFGRFNSQLSKKVFVNINETDRREMSPFFEKIKSLITSPTITIEDKGCKKYVEQSLLHILSTINGDNAFKITANSRRFCYIETSNELIGNTEYFSKLFAFIEKSENQRAFYQFLMQRPVKKNLTIKDIPITEDMKKQFILNRDPIEDYAEEFTEPKNNQDNYNAYKTFIKNQGLQYEQTKKLFEMRFAKISEKYGIDKRRTLVDGVRQTVYYKPSLGDFLG